MSDRDLVKPPDPVRVESVTVGAVVLHYEFWPGIADTLRALAEQTLPLADLVVIDNCSRDNSAHELRAAFPELHVVTASDNRGYGPGMNLGVATLLRRRSLDALLLLTHECVLAPDCTEKLARRLGAQPTVGMVGPLLGHLDDRSRVWSAGGRLDPDTWKPSHMNSPAIMADWRGRPPHPVHWLDGAALMLRRTAWNQLGAFDERYFLYFEETEYCCRLRRRGWELECVPTAEAWQRPGAPAESLMTRNRLRFLARNAPRRVLWSEFVHLTGQVLRPRNRRNPRIAARRRGLVEFLRRRWGAPRG